MSRVSRNSDQNYGNESTFYIFIFVAMAVLIIWYGFCAPAIEIENKQKNRNIEIAERLVENKLNVGKQSYDMELREDRTMDWLNKWTGENVECFVFTNGKHYEVVFESKLVNGLDTYEIVKIKKMVER
ncbi:hypothetical protein CN980_23580 [Bacillus cereus]|uniref:Uncharacterized protein n=1 Tax=Bacillus cereus TaxID=1396 RepID=A0A9X7GN86_BACCE|nr:hypothetical protein [Bacillus cereus]PGO65815.1 hypothetical protein CN980_23580 [Bacillus cereus]